MSAKRSGPSAAKVDTPPDVADGEGIDLDEVINPADEDVEDLDADEPSEDEDLVDDPDEEVELAQMAVIDTYKIDIDAPEPADEDGLVFDPAAVEAEEEEDDDEDD